MHVIIWMYTSSLDLNEKIEGPSVISWKTDQPENLVIAIKRNYAIIAIYAIIKFNFVEPGVSIVNRVASVEACKHISTNHFDRALIFTDGSSQ